MACFTTDIELDKRALLIVRAGGMAIAALVEPVEPLKLSFLVFADGVMFPRSVILVLS